jgi:ABC-2 type transport system permease protein
MNAIAETNTAVAAKPATHTFRLLLKREFWENRGGFLWAPIVTGIIACVFTLIGVIGGSILLNEAKSSGKIDWEKNGIVIEGGVEATRQAIGGTGDIFFLGGVGMALAVMVFVVFFYALGSLYDERRDRSVLFWKSLPVSDAATVLSKASWALILAPAVSLAVGILIGTAILLMMTVAFMLNGIPDASALLLESRPFRILASAFGMLPVYALWALPTIGWLMLCSAWARRLPFLWAVLVPVLGCAMVSMMAGIAGTISGAEFPHGAMWYTLVYRGLMSIIPMSWNANEQVNAHLDGIDIKGPEDFASLIDVGNSWQTLATADLWIGAAIGAAMIYAAIRLRRWRDEG